MCVCMLSCSVVTTLCNLRDCSPPDPLYMGFSRQKYWNGYTFPPPRDLPDPGIKPTSLVSPALQTDSLPLSHQESCAVGRITLKFSLEGTNALLQRNFSKRQSGNLTLGKSDSKART